MKTLPFVSIALLVLSGCGSVRQSDPEISLEDRVRLLQSYREESFGSGIHLGNGLDPEAQLMNGIRDQGTSAVFPLFYIGHAHPYLRLTVLDTIGIILVDEGERTKRSPDIEGFLSIKQSDAGIQTTIGPAPKSDEDYQVIIDRVRSWLDRAKK